MLADSTAVHINIAEKGGDWPPLLSLLSNNSSAEQLQSDIVDWFRENRPDAFEVAGQSGEGTCEARPQASDTATAKGRRRGKRDAAPKVKAEEPDQPASCPWKAKSEADGTRSAPDRRCHLETLPGGGRVWLPRSPAIDQHVQSPREDVEQYCAVMNIWALYQAQQEAAPQQQEHPPAGAHVEVLQRVPHAMFEGAARRLSKRSSTLSIEELSEYKRAAALNVMAPTSASLQAALHLSGGLRAADGGLLPTPTSVLDARGAAAFPASPPAGDAMDFLVASSPGSQSCVGESSGRPVHSA